MRQGGSSEKAVEQLVSEGIDHKDAIEIVKRVRQSMEDRAISKTVVDLLASGASEEEVKQKRKVPGFESRFSLWPEVLCKRNQNVLSTHFRSIWFFCRFGIERVSSGSRHAGPC